MLTIGTHPTDTLTMTPGPSRPSHWFPSMHLRHKRSNSRQPRFTTIVCFMPSVLTQWSAHVLDWEFTPHEVFKLLSSCFRKWLVGSWLQWCCAAFHLRWLAVVWMWRLYRYNFARCEKTTEVLAALNILWMVLTKDKEAYSIYLTV